MACRIRASARPVGRSSESPIMNKTLIALLTAAATLSFGAHADSAADAQARADYKADKAEAKADYKSDKAQAKADLKADKAACDSETSESVEHACKHDAKAHAKKDKADAKLQYKSDKADAKADRADK